MRIERVDPDTLDEAAVAAWFDAWVAAHDADGEPEPAPARARFPAHLRHDGWTDDRPQWWLARDGARPVGWARAALPRTDNTHAAICHVAVAPEHRRRGIGRELVAVARDHARDAGRRVLIGECSDATPGPAFCDAIGASPGVRSIRRVLRLDAAVRASHDALLPALRERAAGYAIEQWRAPVPANAADEVAAVLASMNDAPTDELDYGDETWDAARLRRTERNADGEGLRLTAVAARHEASGELAGLTRMAASIDEPWFAHQWETVVVPAHRGRRLGLLVKLALLDRLRSAEPALTTVVTDNAASNPYMVAVNETLGFRPVDALITYQLALG